MGEWEKVTPVQYANLVGNENNCLCCGILYLQVQPGRNVTVTLQANKITYQMSKWKHLAQCDTQ